MALNGVPIYHVERGGEVTFHGPGQLVVYPLLDLRRPPYKQDLHWYLQMVEEVVIQTLLAYEIKGYRDDINTGVWVGKEKVAAVGVTSSRWITTHGFALNVSPDQSFFFLTPQTLSLVGSREGESQVLKRFCLKGAPRIFRPLRKLLRRCCVISRKCLTFKFKL